MDIMPLMIIGYVLVIDLLMIVTTAYLKFKLDNDFHLDTQITKNIKKRLNLNVILQLISSALLAKLDFMFANNLIILMIFIVTPNLIFHDIFNYVDNHINQGGF